MNQAASQPITTPSTEPTIDDTTPAKSVVPEEYKFTAPEGRELDPKFLAEATPIFKELGLDQAGAQKLVDLANKRAISQSDLAVETVKAMRREWYGETVKALGVSGEDAIKEKLAPIGKMKDAMFVGDPAGRAAFEKAMDLTGAGDHPAIVSTWLKMATAYTEGTHVSGTAASKHGQTPPNTAVKPTAAQAMYPNLPSANAA